MSRDWTPEELQVASAAMKAMGYMGYEEFCELIKEVRRMELRVNLNGKNRKDLVAAIAELTGEKAVYMKVPTCAYKIGAYTVGKFGSLIIEEDADGSEVRMLIEKLTERSFKIEGFQKEKEAPKQKDEEIPNGDDIADKDKGLDSTDTLCIELPRESLPETALTNLDRIIEAKEKLIRKALGADNLAYEITKDKVRFPWFHLTGEDGESEAYMQLISALAEMARNSKRITAKEKKVDNEKYAFRCFLLRLGFIGKEYKIARKILMRNLEGNSAWRNR